MFTGCSLPGILGLQPRDKAAMLVVNTKKIFLQNLHQNRVHFPAERNSFVLDHQHGRRDVTCKPAMYLIIGSLSSHNDDSNEDVTWKLNSRSIVFFVVIQT